jgi:hypothetical protein
MSNQDINPKVTNVGQAPTIGSDANSLHYVPAERLFPVPHAELMELHESFSSELHAYRVMSESLPYPLRRSTLFKSWIGEPIPGESMPLLSNQESYYNSYDMVCWLRILFRKFSLMVSKNKCDLLVEDLKKMEAAEDETFIRSVRTGCDDRDGSEVDQHVAEMIENLVKEREVQRMRNHERLVVEVLRYALRNNQNTISTMMSYATQNDMRYCYTALSKESMDALDNMCENCLTVRERHFLPECLPLSDPFNRRTGSGIYSLKTLCRLIRHVKHRVSATSIDCDGIKCGFPKCRIVERPKTMCIRFFNLIAKSKAVRFARLMDDEELVEQEDKPKE